MTGGGGGGHIRSPIWQSDPRKSWQRSEKGKEGGEVGGEGGD